MTIRKIIAAMAVTLMVAGCAEQGGPITKQQVGTVLGAIGGAAAGSQFGKGAGRTGMIALGTLGGAALGNSLGASLDRIDQGYYNRTSQTAFETAKVGQTVEWRNPDSGNSGSFTPTRTYQQADGTYCREYNQTVVIEGRRQQAFGRACRQPDGSWQIVQ